LLRAISSHSEQVGGQPIRTVLDAGANVGFSSVLFAQHWKRATVVAVEPHPGNYAMLRLNTGQTPSIVALHAALSNHRNVLHLGNGTRKGVGSEWQFTVHEANTTMDNATSFRREHRQGIDSSVAGLTLPQLLNELCLRSFDFVKIDIEGSEASLFGPQATLSWLLGTRYAFIETHNDMVANAHQLTVLSIHAVGMVAVTVTLGRENVVLACRSSLATCMQLCLHWSAFAIEKNSALAETERKKEVVCKRNDG